MLTGDLRARSVHGRASAKVARHASFGATPPDKAAARRKMESVGFDVPDSEQYVGYISDLLAGPGAQLRTGFRWVYLVLVGLAAGAVAVAISFLLREVGAGKLALQERLADDGYGLGIRYAAWVGVSLLLVVPAGVLPCYVEPLSAGSGIPEIKCVLNGIDLPNVLHLKTLVCKAFGIVCSVGAGLPCGKEGPMIHSGAIVAAQTAGANAGSLVTPYRLAQEARDFVAAGAAAGVAAAFGAPIGGVLFAVEEGASHMNPTILVRTFVCAATAGLTARFFAGPLDGTISWGILGTRVPVEFGRFGDANYYNVLELPLFVVLGVVCGLCGALFNFLNTRLSLWRMRHIGPRGHWRFLEVLGVTVVIVSFNFFAPLIQGGSDRMGAFDAAQALFVDAGGEAISGLFHVHDHINNGMLLFFFAVHFLQTVWTYGLGVPSGLFVPSLLAGATLGRVFGQVVRSIDVAGVVTATPEVYALIGASGMLSGMARITISLVVILMETTGEAEWGMPIFVVVMVAKWVGDHFNKGIYDIHIDLRHVPLLEHKAEKQMIALRASDCMAEDVTSFESESAVGDLLDTLRDCRHHAFPVVDPATRRFLGLVERSTLLHVLALAKEHNALRDPAESNSDDASGAVGVVPFTEMVKRGYPAHPRMSEVVERFGAADAHLALDLLPYTNRGCYTVLERAAAMKCWMLFRTMGLRHLPVLGEDHTVRGMLTRKDLLAAAERHELEPCASAKPSETPAPERDAEGPSDISSDTTSESGGRRGIRFTDRVCAKV